MNPLHLLWIMPVSALLGAFIKALVDVAGFEPDWYYRDGSNSADND